MSRREIVHRLSRAGLARMERVGLLRPVYRAPAGEPGKAWVGDFPRVDPAPYREAAEKVLAGRFDIFALKDAFLGFPPQWNKDPKSGVTAPLSFGKSLDYRDERLVGDIKYLWEPNRHSELVTLAQAWQLAREDRYRQGCMALLESWFDQCPYGRGPNWSSALEHGIRLVNWAVAWHLLGSDLARDDAQARFRARWLQAVYEHCFFVVHHLSGHSSANNHLLGELMGLLVASVTWPLWPESPRWAALASRRFEEEALRQNGPDGVNREQGIWYLHEVADMMLLAGLFGQANGIEFSRRYWERLEAMLEFIASIMDVNGRVPLFGDSDDALIVRFVPDAAFCPFRSLLATGAILFERGDFKAKAGRIDDKTRWLLGETALQRYQSLRASTPAPRRAFPEGGYWILGRDFETPNEIRIVADAGPLGYLSIAAHGHADALSFTLSAGGRPILTDPGTYAYHTQPKWRNYFRGTSAHNTVRIDGQDQSIMGGNFLWTEHARARCEQWEILAGGTQRWAGRHDGYLRYKSDPVAHRRVLTFDPAGGVLEVVDHLECSGEHQVEVYWHFSESTSVRVARNSLCVVDGNVELQVTMPDSDWRPHVAVGQEDPPLGWVSRSFDRKVPSPTAVWAGRIVGEARLRTMFEIRIATPAGAGE